MTLGVSAELRKFWYPFSKLWPGPHKPWISMGLLILIYKLHGNKVSVVWRLRSRCTTNAADKRFLRKKKKRERSSRLLHNHCNFLCSWQVRLCFPGPWEISGDALAEVDGIVILGWCWACWSGLHPLHLRFQPSNPNWRGSQKSEVAQAVNSSYKKDGKNQKFFLHSWSPDWIWLSEMLSKSISHCL